MPLASLANSFNPISLEEMDRVKLMNRTDTKYVLNEEILMEILRSVKDDYYILQMQDCRIFPYESLYYDTVKNEMYHAHHNGKPNRHKIRFRKYLQSNHTFLEIKQKVKGSRTIKKRILVENLEISLLENSKSFIMKHTPFDAELLESKLYTRFNRMTLTDKMHTERVTIDTHIDFYFQNHDTFQLNNCVVIEIKRDENSLHSAIGSYLNQKGIHPNGMSKYCLGRALIESNLKKNNFKRKIITLRNIEHGKFYSRSI